MIDFLFISRCDDVITQHTCGVLKSLFELIGLTSKIVGTNVEENDIINSKFIILYRTSYFEHIKILVKKYNKKIGFNIDDYVFGTERIDGVSVEFQNNIRRTIREVDYCFAFTKNLTEKLKEYNKNTFLLDMLILWDGLFKNYNIPLPMLYNNQNVRIGLVSGVSHDFSLLNRIKDIIESAGDIPIEIVYFSNKTVTIEVPSNIKLEKYDFIPTFKEFYTKLFSLRLDIYYTILPENNALIPYKSNLKFRESAYLGIPLVIVDPSEEIFKECVVNGINGYSVKTREEAKNALKELINNKELRKNIGYNSSLYYAKQNPIELATKIYNTFIKNISYTESFIFTETEPLISVIMSTHCRNHGNPNQLRRAMDSVLNQTFKNFEFIIIDDASVDGTSEILKEYMRKDKRIKIFRFKQSCKGFTATRYNFGIRQTKSEIISYMFDDDELKPNHLQVLYENIQNNDMIYTTPECRNPHNKIIDKNFGKDWTSLILTHNYIANIAVGIKKSVFERLGYHDESVGLRRNTDWEMWRRLYVNNCRVKRIQKSTAICYVGNHDSIGVTIPINQSEVLKYVNQDKRQYTEINKLEYEEIKI